MVTRKDVARLAKVSEATVSYVINDTKHVTPEVRKKVLDAVKELHYTPNMVARSLVTNHMYHVVMLVDNMKNPHYNDVMEGMQLEASQKGYLVSVISVDTSDNTMLKGLAARGVDGVILATSQDTVNKLLPPTLSKIGIGELVETDFHQAMLDMIERLVNLGHRKIAYLSGLKMSNPLHNRYQCFCEALRFYGIEYDEQLFVDGDEQERTNELSGVCAAKELLSRKREFTAVVTTNDLMAIGAARIFWENGYCIPRDISLVGCDNLSILQWFTPTLTTMDVGSFETGQAAIKGFIHMINGEEYKKHIVKVKFLEKESISIAKV